MPEPLHLVKIPFRPEKLIGVARGRGIPVRTLDDGYLSHCILRGIWQARAPSPFVLREHGRTLELWGYSRVGSTELVEHARAYGDPTLLDAIVDLGMVASKPMPRLAEGRRIGFRLRACPVVRLARAIHHHRPGAEVDAFLARCFAVGDGVAVSREQVYRGWLATRLDRPNVTGVRVSRIGISGIKRDHFVRRTHGAPREARRLERPDVHFEGDLVVVDGDRLIDWLPHGVGRHRAFGFGALLLVPPATQRTA